MITQRKHEEILAAERTYWQAVVKDLLNRIQAPQIAVAESIPEAPQPYLAYGDDEALAEYEASRGRAVE